MRVWVITGQACLFRLLPLSDFMQLKAEEKQDAEQHDG